MTLIWHNPRCSKSRQALALLEATGRPVTIRKYLEDAPSEAELRRAHAALGGPVIDMLRHKDPAFRSLVLSAQMDNDALFAAMAAHPKLIERPVVFGPNGAVIARPPERVSEVL